MGFRITTGMTLNTYRYNLQNSTKKLSDAQDQVLTHRNFNSYAEDPAAATQAFRLRRDWYQTNNQLANTKDVYSKFDTAVANVQGMLDDLVNPLDKVSIIRGETGTAGESRTALAQVLRETAESMIQGFNQQLGDHFIFAGNDGLNAPFTWKGEDLYFRGINVKSGNVSEPTAKEPDWMDNWKAAIDSLADSTDPADIAEHDRALSWYNYYTGETNVKPDDPDSSDGSNPYLDYLVEQDTTTSEAEKAGWVKYYTHDTTVKPTASEPTTWGDKDKYGVPEKMPVASDDPVEAGWIAYYTDQGNLAKLEEMSKEEMYIDLGMGAQESKPNNPVKGTYFNSALSGLSFTGYGVDEDGDPENFAVLLRELADVFDTWDEDTQSYNPAIAKNSAVGLTSDELQEKAYRLMDKLKAGQEELTAAHVELDARSKYLLTNQERLDAQSDALNVEILDIEQVDLADAITNFSWDYYCYSAALKIGTQLLSQSLIDYMR